MTAAAPRRRLASLAGLVLALGVPVALTFSRTTATAGGGDSVVGVVLNEAVMWGLALIVLALVLFWERRPLGSIGLVRPTPDALRTGAALTVPLLILAVAAGAIVQAAGQPIETGTQETLVMGLPLWVQLFAAISAGFTEEVLFRGYPIERIGELTGRRWVGGVLPVIIFGALHAPFWGVGHALVAGLTGLWLTLIYLWRRNLWIAITAHALVDTLAFVATDFAARAGVTNA